MKFTVLLYGNEQEEAELSQDEWQELIEQHNTFSTRNGDAISAGEALEPSTSARTLRNNGDDVVVSDGPFAETKEQLGGFYLIDAPDLDTAVAMVRDLPLGPHGAIEVRPVMEL
jgi:hypothetical protein